MPIAESVMAYFRIELTAQNKLTREVISEVVRSSPFSLTEEDKEQAIRNLEASFDIQQSSGAAVKHEYKPWLSARKAELDFYYWRRLQNYYQQKNVLPLHVLSTLNRVTDEVLDYSGNPADASDWRRRGMVLGHVQSGKTTNYSSLICKAADAGYKIIILLAGITNSLRAQTQERLDETFIGKKSLRTAVPEPLEIVRFSDRKPRYPVYATTRERDFSSASAGALGITLGAISEPIIFITKKNKSTLENLRNWLKHQNHGAPINEPLLLIDDEADNASVNTLKDSDRVTAINGVIRQILGIFTRSTYIGYTATPFANIFIDPETKNDMLNDDLFPSHFIKALDPPTNYVGATRVFTEEGDLANMVIPVTDFEDLLPLNHKKDIDLSSLPESLYEAIRLFVLTRSIRVLRGDKHSHASMMINISRFNAVQDLAHGLVFDYLEKVKAAIVTNAGLGAQALENPIIGQLSDLYARELCDIEFSFQQILESLHEAAASIEVTTVNMQGGSLNYSLKKETGLQVIAIGGLALSRGLTLEGLTVSYILRNAGASDTLMQMARWFGYRPNYEDICRLYLPEASAAHYDFITGAIEELRDEIKRMETTGQAPSDFGLKVRESPAALRITAANKMRAARKLILAEDYSERHIEGYALLNDKELGRKHRDLVISFLDKLGPGTDSPDGCILWNGIPALSVLRLVDEFRFPPTHPDLAPIQGNASLLRDYIADRIDADCATWGVALPYNKSGKSAAGRSFNVQGHNLTLRSRESGATAPGADGSVYLITKKNKVASLDDEQFGLSTKQIENAKAEKAASDSRDEQMRRDGTRIKSNNSLSWARVYNRHRGRPLLLIHLFAGDLADKEQQLYLDSPIVSLSFCMPSTGIPPKEREYQVNAVYRKQILESFGTEADDDDTLFDEVSND